MTQIKLYHTGGFKMTRQEVYEAITKEAKVYPKIVKAKSDNFIVLQGNTRIMGYLLVIQTLTKTYKDLEVVAISDNMSVYGF